MIDGGSFKFDRDLSIHLFVSTYANNWDKVPNKKISTQEMMYVYSCFLFHREFEFNSIQSALSMECSGRSVELKIYTQNAQ